MDYSKFYFQYINIPYKPEEITRLLERYPLLDSRFDSMDINEIKGLLPSLFNWFESNDLEVDQIFLINHRPSFKQDIHRDYVEDEATGPRLAINIPLNAEASKAVTRVYDIIGNATSNAKRRTENTVIYSKFEPEQVTKITEYYSISPVILNISKPHSAWNNSKVLRGLLTFRFKKDPVNLIRKNT